MHHKVTSQVQTAHLQYWIQLMTCVYHNIGLSSAFILLVSKMAAQALPGKVPD